MMVFSLSLGKNVKGTILCVCADNLAAHGLGGFVESFRGEYVLEINRYGIFSADTDIYFLDTADNRYSADILSTV